MKKRGNKNKIPIYIPNQHKHWLWGCNPEDDKEREKEISYQKKLPFIKK